MLEEQSDTSPINDIYSKLRAEILSGTFAPEGPFSQVKLAERLGVSRTPLREALRKLESEGLIETEHNRRARIASVSPADLDDLYGLRIMLEALAISISVRQATKEDDTSLLNLLHEMEAIAATRDTAAWEVPHQKFHELLIRYAGRRMSSATSELRDHGQRYRTRVLAEPLAWATGAEEHNQIYEAFIARDPALAANRLALHYARTSLTLISQMAPQYEPAAIRGALKFVQAASDDK